MGIYDFYFKWLHTSNFVNIFRQNFPGNVSSLSIDGNSIIHNCAQIVYAYGDNWIHRYGQDKGNFLKSQRQQLIATMTDEDLEKELHISIGNKILELVAAVNPTEYFFFAIDGTIPQAKIVQQRTRRFKNVKKSDVEKETVEIESIIPTTKASVQRFDPNAITPGTDFMIRLDQYLFSFFKRNINQISRTVYYSPHTIKGEGEHKIMEYFRSGRIKGDDFHIIYGLDTDLIMLAMALNISNIILWRDDIKDKLYIDEFKFELAGKMGNSPSATDDFILIMTMAGNDFLPAIIAIDDFEVSLNMIINIYANLFKEYGLRYTTRDAGRVDINWDKFVYFILNLKEHEAYLLNMKSNKEYLKKDSLIYATTGVNESGESVRTNFNYNNFRNYWYNLEFSPKGNRETILKFVKPESLIITLDQINKMSIDYLNGINWISEYYFNGWRGLNLKWYYKYYHSPLALDIYNALATIIQNNEISTGPLVDWKAPTDNKFVNVFEQLLSVLPPASKYLLPKELQFLMEANSPIADYYPIDYIIDYELKDKDYKGIPILPFVNPERITSVYRNYVKFGAEREKYLMYFSNTKDKGWVRAAIQDKIICENQKVKSELASVRIPRGGRGGRGRGRGHEQRGQGQDRNRLQPEITLTGGTFNSIPTINFKL